jgi:pilus assembly protein CpaC
MFIPKKFSIKGIAAVGFAVVLLIFTAGAWAAESVQPGIRKSGKLEVLVGKTIILKSSRPVKRVSIAAPDIADFTLLSSRQVYIIGKAAGVTNMILWHSNKESELYDIEVSFDVSRLKQRIHDILPGEKDIRVIATNNSITLSGMVSSAENLSEVLALARAFAPDDKIVNLLKVAGAHQVMLEVKIAEMSRSVANNLGINFSWVNDTGEFALTLLGGLIDLEEGMDLFPGGDLTVGSQAAGAFRFNSGSNQWTGVLDVLQGNGLVKILAEPTLIAMSGQSADFLAGGEFPIPAIDDEGNVGVEFKTYGVTLAFTPTVLSEKRISIEVLPEVSEIDFTTAVTIAGSVVPGLLARRASTRVELGDGQSFAIAGILKETAREQLSQYPILGDIPILGALFKSKAFQKQETELVIFVTPHLVKPLDLAEQSLPTDTYIEPDDAEFFLWGVFGKSRQKVSYENGGLDGEFGHIFTQ